MLKTHTAKVLAHKTTPKSGLIDSSQSLRTGVYTKHVSFPRSDANPDAVQCKKMQIYKIQECQKVFFFSSSC